MHNCTSSAWVHSRWQPIAISYVNSFWTQLKTKFVQDFFFPDSLPWNAHVPSHLKAWSVVVWKHFFSFTFCHSHFCHFLARLSIFDLIRHLLSAVLLHKLCLLSQFTRAPLSHLFGVSSVSILPWSSKASKFNRLVSMNSNAVWQQTTNLHLRQSKRASSWLQWSRCVAPDPIMSARCSMFSCLFPHCELIDYFHTTRHLTRPWIFGPSLPLVLLHPWSRRPPNHRRRRTHSPVVPCLVRRILIRPRTAAAVAATRRTTGVNHGLSPWLRTCKLLCASCWNESFFGLCQVWCVLKWLACNCPESFPKHTNTPYLLVWECEIYRLFCLFPFADNLSPRFTLW